MQIEAAIMEEEKQLYLPGDLISDQSGLMSGQNTYEENGRIYSSTIGTLNQTNQLVMINPIKHSYEPQIGEIIIGRVVLIKDKKWTVDIGSNSETTLHLNSTYLPEQRQKTEDDEMNMRQIFAEDDYICAEIHSINNDKSINLHTRSHKYGKLDNGKFQQVSHYLIVRQKKHFFKLENEVHVIFGHNGLLFLSNQDRTINQLDYQQNYTIQQRINIGKVSQALTFLNQHQILISQGSIEKLIKLRDQKLSEEDCLTQLQEFLNKKGQV